MYDKWNHICNHLLLYHFLLITVPEIPYCMRVSIKFCWISYSISYSLLLLLPLSCLLLDYLQLYQIFLIAASVTTFHISYNYWVSYCLGLVVLISQRSFNSVCYYFLLSTSIRYVLPSVIRIRSFYLLGNCASYSSKLLLSTYGISYPVVLSASHVR